MDTGNGSFERIDTEQKDALFGHIRGAFVSLKKSGVFEINEEVALKGSDFKITNITSHGLSLKLLPNSHRSQLIEQFKKEQGN